MIRIAFTITAFIFICYTLTAQSFQYQIFDTDLPSKSLYKERRARLLDSLPARSVAIIHSADERTRQNDVSYEYRQNSNMLYLTGFPHPGATLMLIPSGITIGTHAFKEILFVAERNIDREQWQGVSAGPLEAMSEYGIDTALKESQLTSVLASMFTIDSTSAQAKSGDDSVSIPVHVHDSVSILFVDSWPTSRVSMKLLGKNLYVDKEIKNGLTQKFAGLEIRSGIDALASMREIKDTAELRLMRKAIEISCKGHAYAMSHAKTGMHEYEVEALIEFGFKTRGAEDVGYPSIVGSGYNSCILHYSTNRREALAGDLILADCGAEYHGYTADITRTFPLGGHFTDDQRTIYNVVLEAQDSGIAACRAGAPFKSSHIAALKVIQRRLMELKIISDTATARKFFMHGTSHYLGLDVHDVGTKGPLRANTVITVEPGLYFAEGSPCDKRWWNIGVRIEDDILVTNGDPELLSRELPRTAEAIEQLVGSALTDH